MRPSWAHLGLHSKEAAKLSMVRWAPVRPTRLGADCVSFVLAAYSMFDESLVGCYLFVASSFFHAAVVAGIHLGCFCLSW